VASNKIKVLADDPNEQGFNVSEMSVKTQVSDGAKTCRATK
jgi:hypothetical protein